MSLVKWDNEMSVGIASIDVQHQKLLAILNNFDDASNDGYGAKAASQIIDDLIQYTAEHFAYEEKLFSETNYPDAATHIVEHDILVKKVMDIKSKMGGEATDALSKEIKLLIVRWFLEHTLGSDKQYSAHLIRAGIK